MAYQTALFPMTLCDLLGYLPIANLFKSDFSYSCAAVDKVSTDRASRGLSAIAELLVKFLSEYERFRINWLQPYRVPEDT